MCSLFDYTSRIHYTTYIIWWESLAGGMFDEFGESSMIDSPN